MCNHKKVSEKGAAPASLTSEKPAACRCGGRCRKVAQSTGAVALLSVLALPAQAQGLAEGLVPTDLTPIVYLLMGLILAVTLVICLVAYYAVVMLRVMVTRTQTAAQAVMAEAEISADAVRVGARGWWQRLDKKLTDAIPLEREEDIVLDHNYDGIRELDNHMPPWWVAMFYATIVFAGVYVAAYHFTDWAPLQEEEYQMELAQAEEAATARRLLAVNSLDETNVTFSNEASILAKGQSIYTANCAACHGAQGQGGVGPNLTDEYWLHGGDIKDVFAVIKYGVPQKGMIAWQAKLQPSDMRDVAAYILTLQNTNPPNAKEAQGEKFVQDKLSQAASADKDLATANF